MSVVVSDTTPISCLLRVGRTDLLATLFPDLQIPDAVAQELDRAPTVLGDWRSMMGQHVRIVAVEPSPLLKLLEDELDAGEAAALALAVSEHAALVLIDEARGRAVASRLGLVVVGTIGIVAMARRRGIIASARALIAQLRARGGLWVSDKLVADMLLRLGE